MNESDDTERFDGDESAPQAGYRLRASWGPPQWRIGGGPARTPTLRTVAYAPSGETLFFVVGNTLLELDRRGRRVRAPHVIEGKEVWVTFSEDGTHAAYTRDRSALCVLELASMREVFHTSEVRGAHVPVLSGDGAFVGADPHVWRVVDGARVDEVDRRLLSLSHDGALALCATHEPKGHAVRVTLRAVGGGNLRSQVTHEGFSWNVAWSRDGRRVAWARRDDVEIWGTSDTVSRTVGGTRVLGPVAFVDSQLLVNSEGALELLGPDGRRQRRVSRSLGWIVAVSPRGDRALLDTKDGPGEVDLATGALCEQAGNAPARAEISYVAWDHQGRSAVVLRADGDLCIWDVERWRMERVLDDARTLLARTPPVAGTPQWTFRVELLRLAFTRDGSHLLACDPSGAASMLTRGGLLVWRRALSPDVAWGPGWVWRAGGVADTGEVIEVRGVWRRSGGHEPDGTPIVDDRVTVTTLDPRSGAVLAHRDEPEVPWSSAPYQLPRIHVVLRGAGGEVRVGDAALEIDPPLGAATNVFPSPDGATLLVSTRAGLLLRFDRAL